MTRPHALWYKDQMSGSAGRHCGCALLSSHNLAHAEPQAWKIGSPLKTISHSSFQGRLQASPLVRSHPRLLLSSRSTLPFLPLEHSPNLPRPHQSAPSALPNCWDFQNWLASLSSGASVALVRYLPLPLPSLKILMILCSSATSSRKPSILQPPSIQVDCSC